MLCVPPVRLALLHAAVLELAEPAGKATAPQPVKVVPPSVKPTLPVGAAPLTVAVKVTLVPTIEGLAELASEVPLDAVSIVCASVLLVEPALPLSPP